MFTKGECICVATIAPFSYLYDIVVGLVTLVGVEIFTGPLVGVTLVLVDTVPLDIVVDLLGVAPIGWTARIGVVPFTGCLVGVVTIGLPTIVDALIAVVGLLSPFFNDVAAVC